MSDKQTINCPNEWCDNAIPADLEGEQCADCEAKHQATATYWGALYRAENHYTREEIEDAYSHPTEHSKRDILITRLGL